MTSHSNPLTFCIKSVKQQKLEQNITATENFDFGEALGRVYPLLDIIFGYLPINDLKTCIKVSPVWKEKAGEAMSRRTAPSWCTCYKVNTEGHKSNVISHSDNLNYNNVEIGILIYDSCRWKINRGICLHSNIVELSRKSVPEYLEEELVPKQVDYCLLSVHRAVSYFGDIRTVKDIQTYASIFEGVFIPKIPSMRTIMFHCNPSKKKDLKGTINRYISNNEEVKCVLVFCKTQPHETIYNLLEILAPKGQPSPVALGGGIIKGTKTFQQVSRGNKVFLAKDVVCIAFLKDKTSEFDNFRAYSRVIKGSFGLTLAKNEFHPQLVDFKKNVTLKKHSLGFRFCCSAKCEDTELESFHELFPGLPLLGFDAHGEIGWNSYPNASDVQYDESSNPKRKKRNKDYPVAEHFFSTIFVLITWD